MASEYYSRPIVALLLALIGGIVIGGQFPGYSIAALCIAGMGAGFLAVRIIRKAPAGGIPFRSKDRAPLAWEPREASQPSSS